MLSIQTNVNSMNAQENLRVTNQFQGRTIARLTSGYRINESGDDAAGLAVANKYRSDVTELMQGVRNANDGLSTLQIIDGGLNNVSKMLDRLKTLATQSASATFTGSRATLNQEYTDLLTEIDRQAANIGLGVGDTNAGRNNSNIQVFLGGGSATANSMIGVDLSGAGSRVDSTSLNIATTVISGERGGVQLADLGATPATDSLMNNATQVFHVSTAAGQKDVTVTGDANGLTGDEIVTQLNAGLVGTGVNAFLSDDGRYVRMSSDGGFSIDVAASSTGLNEITGAGTVVNDRMFRTTEAAVTAVTGTAAGVDGVSVDFVIQGRTFTVNQLAGDTVDDVFDSLTAGLEGSGIEVIRNGNNVSFQSTSDFTVTKTQIDTAADDGAGGIATANGSATDASTASIDPTDNAKAALAAINEAVSSLGRVQGSVGTGQNRLTYAIQLAQSQITSFSAAESRIRDADVAQEAANLTKAQVLQQASIAALAQANSAPQAVLSLLRG